MFLSGLIVVMVISDIWDNLYSVSKKYSMQRN